MAHSQRVSECVNGLVTSGSKVVVVVVVMGAGC